MYAYELEAPFFNKHDMRHIKPLVCLSKRKNTALILFGSKTRLTVCLTYQLR